MYKILMIQLPPRPLLQQLAEVEHILIFGVYRPSTFEFYPRGYVFYVEQTRRFLCSIIIIIVAVAVAVAVAIYAAVVNETAYTRDQSCHPELNTQFDWRGAIP